MHSWKGIHDRPQDFRFNPQAPLARGLVFAGLGRYTKSARYQDSSLYGNHGTLTAMTPSSDWLWDSTLGRWCLDFDGSNDKVVYNLLFTALNGASACSVLTWLLKTDAGNFDSYRGVLAIGEVNGNTRSPWLWGFSGSTNYVLSIGTPSNTTSDGQVIFGPATDGAWQHVAGTWDGLTVRSFLNGNNTGVTDTTAGTALVGAVDESQLGKIGGYGNWLGSISDMLIYNRALSTAEIQQLADPSNAMLSGLILPPKRRVWAAVTGAPPAAFKAYWATRRQTVIGAGVI